MSGKSCALTMHSASVANDMKPPSKDLRTTRGKADAINSSPAALRTSTSNNSSISGNATSNMASSPTAVATSTPASRFNSVVYNRSDNSKSSRNSEDNCDKNATHGKINLPLPPPGTGIRHNVKASADAKEPATGVPNRTADVASTTAVKAAPRTAEDIENARLRKEKEDNTSNIKNDNYNKKKEKPLSDSKMEETDKDDDASDSASSGSLSDDNSLSTSSSFDSGATSDLDDSDSSQSSTTSGPLHEQMESETVCPDLECAVVAHRKKALLLSRLSEVSARGTLAVIDLARRGLGVNDVALIEQAILVNPNLSVLKLGYNDLGDVGAHSIANALCIETNGTLEHRALGVLDLSFNHISDEGCGELAIKAIAGNYYLRTLFLTGNNIGERGALSIAGALVHGCYLCRLHLTANKIGPEGTKALATAVAEIDARLQIQEAAGRIAAVARGPSATPQRMEHLFLGSTGMQSVGFYTIPSMLLSNASLQVLCLTDNNIDDNDMGVLAQAFTQNKKVPLESIMLSFNQITDVGVEALMNAIWGSPTLKEIKLDNNRMTDRGAQLCAVVSTSITLVKLDISFNAVTTVGIRAIMKNLSEDTNMRRLGMSGIGIDLNAAKAVSFALAYNTSLETIYLDNCQVGYSAQRHITAGIVSNQKAPLKMLTGFPMSPIAVTLGMPALPEEWSNEKVLAFVRLMWRNWGKKRGPCDDGEEEAKGPAPPAAVAAAAKIALASLGANPTAELYVEPLKHETYNDAANIDPLSSLIPDNAALIERTFSGRWQLPKTSDDERVSQNGFLEAWNESSAFGRPATITYHASEPSMESGYHEIPLYNPEQRNRNLRWLRTHFRPLIDVGKLPFNNADMWQLHQYYFSPPYYGDGIENEPHSPVEEDDAQKHLSSESSDPSLTKKKCVAPPLMPSSASSPKPPSTHMGRAISFQALNSAVRAAGLMNGSHKRRGHGESIEEDGMNHSSETNDHSAKRTKNLKPRIAYYPRIRAKLESLGTKPLEQTLSLLRKLKYVETVIFPEHASYEDLDKLRETEHSTRLDVEMILLDLI